MIKSASIFTWLAVSALFVSSVAAQPCLIITEVVDGDLAGGNPKFVEVTNTGSTDYTFAAGGIIVQSNGSSDVVVDVDLTGVTIMAGQSYVIQSSANNGQVQYQNAYMGTDADLYTPAFFGNGDDGYLLTDMADGSNILDIYGEFGVDGTGTAWEYTDSYAFRNSNINDGNDGVFVASEWTFGGVAALDAPDDPTRIALLQANTTPKAHVLDMVNPACDPPVPTMSQWGMIVMTILVLTAGTVVFRRSTRTVAAN